jgi:hypothetical protein
MTEGEIYFINYLIVIITTSSWIKRKCVVPISYACFLIQWIAVWIDLRVERDNTWVNFFPLFFANFDENSLDTVVIGNKRRGYIDAFV